MNEPDMLAENWWWGLYLGSVSSAMSLRTKTQSFLVAWRGSFKVYPKNNILPLFLTLMSSTFIHIILKGHFNDVLCWSLFIMQLQWMETGAVKLQIACKKCITNIIHHFLCLTGVSKWCLIFFFFLVNYSFKLSSCVGNYCWKTTQGHLLVK